MHKNILINNSILKTETWKDSAVKPPLTNTILQQPLFVPVESFLF